MKAKTPKSYVGNSAAKTRMAAYLSVYSEGNKDMPQPAPKAGASSAQAAARMEGRRAKFGKAGLSQDGKANLQAAAPRKEK